MVQDDDQSAKNIELVKQWQQGDLIDASELPFVHLADLREPLTDASRQLAADEKPEKDNPFAAVSVEARGFVIVTQTCDIVKSIAQLPTIQLAVLESVSQATLANAKKGSSGKYLFLPAFENDLLVANLDKIATAEKSVLFYKMDLSTQRSARNDEEIAIMGRAIARKFDRFAFPDDFNIAMGKARVRILDKSGKDSLEGKAVDAIKEIRVVTENGWEANFPNPTLLFFFENLADLDESVKNVVAKIVDRFEKGGRFPDVPEFRCAGYADVDADTYRRSSPLDLDYLSGIKK